VTFRDYANQHPHGLPQYPAPPPRRPLRRRLARAVLYLFGFILRLVALVAGVALLGSVELAEYPNLQWVAVGVGAGSLAAFVIANDIDWAHGWNGND
jgi:hypothetical protein